MHDFIHYKHNPRTFKDIKYNPETVEKLKKLSSGGNFDSILLSGPAGSGKKTLLQCYLNNYYNNDNLMFIKENHEFTLKKNNYKVYYNSSQYHFEVYLTDNPKINNIILKELVDYFHSSLSITNEITVIMIYNIDKLYDNNSTVNINNIIKNIIDRHKNIRILCTSRNRAYNIAIPFINLRVRSLKTLELLKITNFISKEENLNLDYNKLHTFVKNCNRNLSLLLNLLQNFINNDYKIDSHLEDILNILKKKDLKDYYSIKNIINKILIENCYKIDHITHYLEKNIIHDVIDKIVFLEDLLSINNNNLVTNSARDIIYLDSLIFIIYKNIIKKQ